MSYLVLARKYRPTSFAEVIGQDHIIELLQKAVSSQRLAHAFLFCGPRGIGKTSCARILAKSLNCEKGPTLKPCNNCAACREIAQGSNFDVLEIDGASNRGIDEIRTLRENVKFVPSYGRYKIYIVDEVHMLTMEAFNALLKTLEEPPDHVKFILATTDPNRMPGTIISRCQRYDFKRIPVKTIVETLRAISQKEKLKIQDDAMYAVAKAAQGSLRDALSILDQLGALQERDITGEDVYSMLGMVETDFLFALTDALADKNCAQALEVLDQIIDKGKDIKQLSKDLTEHFRNLMIIKIGGKTLGRLVDYPINIKELYLTQSERFSLREILAAIDVLIEAQETARITESLRIALEIALAKLTYKPEAQTTPARPMPPAPRKDAPVSPKPGPFAPPPPPVEKTAPKPPAQAQAPKPERADLDLTPPGESENEGPPENTAEMNIVPGDLNLKKIQDSWDALTYAVSRVRMSIATYLQEGFPLALEEGKLIISFSPEHTFHKETLEHKEHVQLVEKVFSEKLHNKVFVQYKIVKEQTAQETTTEEPLIKSALETFKGKIVDKWHQ